MNLLMHDKIKRSVAILYVAEENTLYLHLESNINAIQSTTDKLEVSDSIVSQLILWSHV
jgi:hypothetical protein